MSIQTTVVGSYPLPHWLAQAPSEEALADAMRVVIHTQEQAGLDLVCDGELYRFDVNVRDSLATGFVGGGGIGFLLFNSIQLFQYRDASMELLVLLVVLLAVERVSTILRSRIV